MRRVPLAALAAALACAASAAAQTPSPAAPTRVPGELSVGVSLPSPGLQAGAVGPDGVLTYARGLEIDLARRIAAELGIPRVRFVNEPFFANLLTAGDTRWDMALAGISITPDRRERVAFSRAYLDADQGVLLRRGLAASPTTIAALRPLQLCTERNSTGYRLIRTTIRPAKPPLQAGNAQRLFGLLQGGRCDAAVYDTPILGAEVAGAADRYGPLVGRIVTGERYGAVFPKASRLRGRVDGIIRTLVTDGTVRALSRRWIATDVRALPVIR
jgi:polar amino acid transport system substrate-binding protein